MSTNHNRIKVADLEKNQPNKVLITNEKGELEFNDVNNLKTEKYNALDCTTEGKALDARQGKVLKEMIDNISSDEFITKNSKSFIHMFYIGDIDMVDVDDKSYLKFEQGMTGLRSLNIQDPKNLYHGRDFILKNATSGNVTLYHMQGTGNFRFNFPEGKDIILKPEESAHIVMRAINFTNNGGLLDYIGLSTVDIIDDLTTGGSNKALSAEMGKKLNLAKLSATFATDSETQINYTVAEDEKVISRLKLFNWWEWIKSQTQTISGIWNFKQGIKVEKQNGQYTYTSELTEYGYSTQINSMYGLLKSQYENGLIRWRYNNNNIEITHSDLSQNLYIKFPSKSGILSLKNDFITAAAGTTDMPSLIIPNGELTTVPQDGAIERDENGQLWETHTGIRSQILSKNYISSIYNSGTYTPTLENTLNITGATLTVANYTRIDNIVNVMVALTATPVALGSDVEISISLPINRNLSTKILSGTAAGSTVNTNFSAQVFVNNSLNASVKYKANTSGFSNIVANFSYAIN
ncbi:hypothetical protein [Flavobacterium sp. LC2016-01]|uniref:hypothetical protein n=1 Tax=Flavobacterium sp. LC2016-01 TaxID=2675876 RepID=UPI0012BA8789|nr:hypothetical protein [Flavobacterium sp. LC2016-01]MTH18288.1 hypothetical protein [Flavobacterium sp. LC2016-01]